VDLQEKHQIDMAGQVAKMKARARPWRSIIALVLAVASGLAAWKGAELAHNDPVGQSHATGRIVMYSGAAAFLVFGTAAVFGLSGMARNLLRPVIGSAHAGVVRYALVLAGVFVILLVTFDLAHIEVRQLLVGGAVTGVLLGIAAQQSLANLFAGMVLLFARPFHVGDRVWIRSGALGGTLEGIVTDISLTYVRLDTDDGSRCLLPNSQVLAAVVGPAAAKTDEQSGVATMTEAGTPGPGYRPPGGASGA